MENALHHRPGFHAGGAAGLLVAAEPDCGGARWGPHRVFLWYRHAAEGGGVVQGGRAPGAMRPPPFAGRARAGAGRGRR
eukprot:4704649-Pyramimonas_sp.AAC.1